MASPGSQLDTFEGAFTSIVVRSTRHGPDAQGGCAISTLSPWQYVVHHPLPSHRRPLSLSLVIEPNTKFLRVGGRAAEGLATLQVP